MKRSAGAVVAVATCLLLVVAAFAARRSSASAPNVLRAEKLELMDSGKVAAVLQGSPDGLEVRGPDGKLRAIVGSVGDGAPALGLFDENGQATISLDITSDGQAGIHLASEDGTRSLSLIAPPKGGPGISLKSGENGTYVALDDEGRLVSYLGCGVEPHVLAPAPPPVCQ